MHNIGWRTFKSNWVEIYFEHELPLFKLIWSHLQTAVGLRGSLTDSYILDLHSGLLPTVKAWLTTLMTDNTQCTKTEATKEISLDLMEQVSEKV